MFDPPQTHYAKGHEGDVAYQVVGDGPMDLVMVPGWFSHIDMQWDDPQRRAFIGELVSFARVILYDKRGTGLSDPVDGVPTVENRVDDLRAVMDAAESRSAALFGFSEGGAISLLFAATYPERVRALILYGTTGGLGSTDLAVQARGVETLMRLRRTIDHWGEGQTIDWAAPSLRDDAMARKRIGALERAAMSPKMALLTWQAVTRHARFAAHREKRWRSDAGVAPQARGNPYRNGARTRRHNSRGATRRTRGCRPCSARR